MRKPRHLIAATLLGSLALGAALPANAHGGEGRGWGERHHHHHRDRYRDAYYYGAPPGYVAPPPAVVYERPIVYAPQPVYAYPARPAITIGIPPLVIPLR